MHPTEVTWAGGGEGRSRGKTQKTCEIKFVVHGVVNDNKAQFCMFSNWFKTGDSTNSTKGLKVRLTVLMLQRKCTCVRVRLQRKGKPLWPGRTFTEVWPTWKRHAVIRSHFHTSARSNFHTWTKPAIKLVLRTWDKVEFFWLENDFRKR